MLIAFTYTWRSRIVLNESYLPACGRIGCKLIADIRSYSTWPASHYK